VKPWKTERAKAEIAGLPSFNSATAVKPWKTMLVSSGTMNRWSLQFGHGGEAVEDSQSTVTADGAIIASIRPRR